MPNVTITPVAGRVLLHIPPPAEVAGILKLPPQKQWRGSMREAIVKALPPRYHGQLSIGDRVLLPQWPDREILVNGETLVFIDEDKLPCAVEA
jgi:co-chaperonin GroES (HSP10)